MTFNEYQKAASRTVNVKTLKERLNLAALGIGGESGECIEPVKKFLFHDKPLNIRELALELGDLLWYLSLLADSIGYDLEEVASMNIEKLLERYPV